MYHKILVPVDFSPTSDNALVYAINLAKKWSAELLILHVNYLPVIDATIATDIYQNYLDESNNISENSYSKLKEKYLSPAGIKFHFITKLGFVVDEINKAAIAYNVDLILLGSMGANGIEELLIGSNTASLVARSVKPVMIIPPNKTYENYRRLIYASDFSESNFDLFKPVLEMVKYDQAEFEIVHVQSKNEKDLLNYEFIIDNYRNNLNYDKLSFSECQDDHVMRAIDEYVQKGICDVVVVSRHKRNFFERLFHRSVSKQMAYHTQIPLLVLVQ